MVVVFPVPGPPVKIKIPWVAAAEMASFWISSKDNSSSVSIRATALSISEGSTSYRSSNALRSPAVFNSK